MTPTEIIADLDAAVRDFGEDIVLRREHPAPGGTLVPLDVGCRAVVRGYQPEELRGAISQEDSKVVVSPTEMTHRQWCWPPRVDDKVVIGGEVRNVEAANPVIVGGVLVRIEMRVRG